MAVALIVFSAIVAYLVYAVISFYRYVATFPKGPRPLPLIGNLLQVSLRKFEKRLS